jgi:hypothetical protein
MTSDPIETDPGLRAVLSDVVPPVDERADWVALRRRVVRGADGELARRRIARTRRLVLAGVGAVAAVIVLAAIGSVPRTSGTPQTVSDGGPLVAADELLNDRRSDDELRAVLDGADDADALLLIAADEARAAEEVP